MVMRSRYTPRNTAMGELDIHFRRSGKYGREIERIKTV